MRLIGPEDMKDFRCLAGTCRHTCCRGWEIDVDDESAARYRAAEGRIGEKLRENLVTDEDGTHFRLDSQERCPFLNREGLCELILEMGEDALCQICRDHPRFRNFYSDHVEIGLGLVCEAAARQAVEREEPLRLITLQDDGVREMVPEEEQWLQAAQAQLIGLAQRREDPMPLRLQAIRHAAGVPELSLTEDMLDLFMELEVLDPVWRELLGRVRAGLDAPWRMDGMEKPAEQLLCSLLCRHIAGALDDGAFRERVLFCLLALEIIFRTADVLDMEGKAALAEAARLFSGEIEYSDENIGALLDRLSEILEESPGQ